MRVSDIYPGVEHELYSTNYWHHWNDEAVQSKQLLEHERVARAAEKAAVKAEASKGMKGVKLAVQWKLDHPFRKRTYRGTGSATSAFLDSDTPKLYTPPPDHLSEFRLDLKSQKTWPGGKFAYSGREDSDKVFISKEHAAKVPMRTDAGPGSYNLPSSLGDQYDSTKRSAPAISISAATQSKGLDVGPGPGAYMLKFSRRIHGEAPRVPFTTAPRLVDYSKTNTTPGPIYNVALPPAGPKFSFSVGGDARRTREALLADPEIPKQPSHELPQGFGFGCVVEEHIKYGHCLDGRCSKRANWEDIQATHAKSHKRFIRTLEREVRELRAQSEQIATQTAAAEVALTQEGAGAGAGAGAGEGAGAGADAEEATDSAPPHTPMRLTNSRGVTFRDVASGGTDGGSDAHPLLAGAMAAERSGLTTSASASASSTASAAGGRSRKGDRKAKKKKGNVLVPNGVVWNPPSDIFPPFCMACGNRVSCMTTKERILATNRQLAVHCRHFVSHVVRPGAKKTTIADRLKAAISGPPLNSARSSLSLASIPSAKSLPTVKRRDSDATSIASRLSARSSRSGRSRASSARSASTTQQRHTWRGTPKSGSLSSAARKSGWAGGVVGPDGVERLVHQPERVRYVPGCGYFCDKKCTRAFVVANVAPDGSSSNTKRNVKRRALLHTVLHDNLEELSFIMRNGSDCNITAEQRRYPLHIAAEEGHARILERLFCGSFNVLLYQECSRHHPADCGCFNQRPDVNCRDIDGATPLHLAARGGKLRAVQTLLAHGASTEVVDFKGVAPHEVATTQEVFQLIKNATAVRDAEDQVRDVELRRYKMLRAHEAIDRTATPAPRRTRPPTSRSAM